MKYTLDDHYFDNIDSADFIYSQPGSYLERKRDIFNS